MALQWKVGDLVDVLTDNIWWAADVLRINADGTIKAHYRGWPKYMDESVDSIRVFPFGTGNNKFKAWAVIGANLPAWPVVLYARYPDPSDPDSILDVLGDKTASQFLKDETFIYVEPSGSPSSFVKCTFPPGVWAKAKSIKPFTGPAYDENCLKGNNRLTGKIAEYFNTCVVALENDNTAESFQFELEGTFETKYRNDDGTVKVQIVEGKTENVKKSKQCSMSAHTGDAIQITRIPKETQPLNNSPSLQGDSSQVQGGIHSYEVGISIHQWIDNHPQPSQRRLEELYNESCGGAFEGETVGGDYKDTDKNWHLCRQPYPELEIAAADRLLVVMSDEDVTLRNDRKRHEDELQSSEKPYGRKKGRKGLHPKENVAFWPYTE